MISDLNISSLEQGAFAGKRVLVRSSLNVPMSADGAPADEFRLLAALPTIRFLREQGARVIVMGHLGRPGGKEIEELSLRGVAVRLSELLHCQVPLIGDPAGEQAGDYARFMRPGDVILLENLRFDPGEEANDPKFARALAGLGEAYVNDSFDTSHRAHASIVGVPLLLPASAGLLFEKELASLSRVLTSSVRPFVVIVGGKKVETKLAFIDHMAETADAVLLGNLIAREAEKKKIPFRFPKKMVLPSDGVPFGAALDIGPETRDAFLSKIEGAKMIVWTGPLGKFEEKEYAQGSLAVARAIVRSDAYSVAGGGDLVAFLNAYAVKESFDLVSTAGGAMLAFLAGEELPGIVALEKAGVRDSH